MTRNFQTVNSGLGIKGSATDPASPNNGDIYYNSTDNKFKFYQNGVWSNLGTPSYSNYISQPSPDNGTVTGWTSQGTLTRTTNSTYVPRASIGSAFLFTSSGSLQVTKSPIVTIDDVDLYKKMSIGFSYKADKAFKVLVFCSPNSDMSSPVAVPLSTDVTAVTTVAAGSGDFFASFNGDGTRYYQLWLQPSVDNVINVGFSDVFLSSDKIALPGAAVGPMNSYTPVLADFGNATGLTISPLSKIYWKRLGDSVYLRFYAVFTGSGSDAGSFSLKWSSINSVIGGTVTPAANTSIPVEMYIGSTGVKPGIAQLETTAIYFYGVGENSPLDGVEFGTGGGTLISEVGFQVTLPVTEWIGSGNVNVQTGRQDFIGASAHRNNVNQTGVNPNNSAAQLSLNSVASFAVYGYNVGAAYDTSGAVFTVPANGAGKYIVTASVLLSSSNVLANTYALYLMRGASFGAATMVSQIDRFVATLSTGFQMSGTTTTVLAAGDKLYLGLWGAGNNSSSTLTVNGSPEYTNFTVTRIADEYGNPVVGFDRATQESYGLVKAGQVPGTNTNDSAEAGNVGEIISNATGVAVAPTSSNSWINVASVTLTPGQWTVVAGGGFSHGTISGLTTVATAISTSSNALDSAGYANINSGPQAGANITYRTAGVRTIKVASGTTQTVYFVGLAVYSSVGTATWTTAGYIEAKRDR